MRIRQVVIDSNDPRGLADFWSLATGRSVQGDADPYLRLEDPEGRDVTLLLQHVDDRLKPGKNVVHVDLFTSDPKGETERLVSAGASKLEEHGEGRHRWFVLADPQGNEFCVISSGDQEPA
jgi:Glyoxalase-like domain